jgi:HAMP domain-containing protein
MAQLTIKLKVRWWLKPAVLLLIVACRFTAWRPREQFIERLVRHAMYIESAK